MGLHHGLCAKCGRSTAYLKYCTTCRRKYCAPCGHTQVACPACNGYLKSILGLQMQAHLRESPRPPVAL